MEVLDELLEMSHRMKRRLDQLQVKQAVLADRLTRGVDNMRGVIEAAEEAIKV